MGSPACRFSTYSVYTFADALHRQDRQEDGVSGEVHESDAHPSATTFLTTTLRRVLVRSMCERETVYV
eukprot:3241814-Pyramimonas_sp.AAC.1